MTSIVVDTPPRGLRLGRRHPVYLRREEITLGLRRPVRLLYASDLHLAGGSLVASQVFDAAARERPDVVLLGGDLVEGKRGHLPLLAMVEQLAAVAPVLAVEGNHDRFWGASAVRGVVRRGGGHWLLDEPVSVGGLHLIATLAQATQAIPSEPTCLVGHDPSLFPRAVAAGIGLVLAGHLHGGQCVFAERGGKLYPAALFYRWNGLRFALGGSEMLVSRGVSDTLPVRYNCPTEVILCTVS